MSTKPTARTAAPGINAKPSEWFAYGLTEWTLDRAHELTDPPASGCGYYLDSCEEHIGYLWRDHTGASAATLAELDGEVTPFSFKVINTSVSAILGGIARQLGWRIVPFAQMAAAQTGDGELLARVEAECREWAVMADAIHAGWRATPNKKAEIDGARILMRGQVAEALKIVERLRADTSAKKI